MLLLSIDKCYQGQVTHRCFIIKGVMYGVCQAVCPVLRGVALQQGRHGVQGGLTRPWYGAHYIKHHPLSHDIWVLAYLITLSILCVVGKQICGHGQHKLDLLFRMPRVDTYQHMDHALQVTNSCYVPVNTTKISWAGVLLCRHVFDFVLNIYKNTVKQATAQNAELVGMRLGARLGAAAKYWGQGGVLIEMYTKYKIFKCFAIFNLKSLQV